MVNSTPVMLMVDDDEQDIYFTRRAFLSEMPELIFDSVSNGAELFDYLNREGKYRDIPHRSTLPVLLLDINMPRENGFDILRKLRKDPDHYSLGVVMLSTSVSEVDISNAYAAGANSYICKSINANGMKTIATCFCEYWFGLAKLPGRSR